MRGWRSRDERTDALDERQRAGLADAFAAALEMYGCVGCARKNLAMDLDLLVEGKENELLGPNRYVAEPEEKDGLRFVCRECGGVPRAFRDAWG